ncbi:MAG: Gfo/Idh/MocA family oxidoreductase [Candidatus Latescibacteria bacterium]|jgi:predicted dehydrogenase|nr:Gfo/Idh/MocA family oxidoreductase [Candidatus Latescibacterota bacterium]
MSDPRICIVGAGSLSTKRIYPGIGASGAQLVGVCDLDQEKAKRNARRFGGDVYSDMELMLESVHPDGVILCIGPDAHATLAPVIMRRGIPVYTEKPPAPSAAAAYEVARVSAETGVLCATGFKKRYATAYVRAKEWLDSFPSEDLCSVGMDYCSARYSNETPRSEFLLDFCIHIIDLVQYLFGDVVQVFTFTQDHHAYAVSLRFQNGAVGTLNLNDARSFQIPTEEVELSVRGGHFMTVHNSSSWRISEHSRAIEWREPPTFTSAGDSGHDTGHLAELQDFISAIVENRSMRSDIRESYKTMVLYEAIKTSADSGSLQDVFFEPI